MNESTPMSSGKFRELKTYLAAIPETLPLPSDSLKINQLLDFSLDENWVTDAGVKAILYSPPVFHMESMWNENIPWNPHGIALESIWNPCGIHVHSME